MNSLTQSAAINSGIQADAAETKGSRRFVTLDFANNDTIAKPLSFNFYRSDPFITNTAAYNVSILRWVIPAKSIIRIEDLSVLKLGVVRNTRKEASISNEPKVMYPLESVSSFMGIEYNTEPHLLAENASKQIIRSYTDSIYEMWNEAGSGNWTNTHAAQIYKVDTTIVTVGFNQAAQIHPITGSDLNSLTDPGHLDVAAFTTKGVASYLVRIFNVVPGGVYFYPGTTEPLKFTVKLIGPAPNNTEIVLGRHFTTDALSDITFADYHMRTYDLANATNSTTPSYVAPLQLMGVLYNTEAFAHDQVMRIQISLDEDLDAVTAGNIAAWTIQADVHVEGIKISEAGYATIPCIPPVIRYVDTGANSTSRFYIYHTTTWMRSMWSVLANFDAADFFGIHRNKSFDAENIIMDKGYELYVGQTDTDAQNLTKDQYLMMGPSRYCTGHIDSFLFTTSLPVDDVTVGTSAAAVEDSLVNFVIYPSDVATDFYDYVNDTIPARLIGLKRSSIIKNFHVNVFLTRHRKTTTEHVYIQPGSKANMFMNFSPAL